MDINTGILRHLRSAATGISELFPTNLVTARDVRNFKNKEVEKCIKAVQDLEEQIAHCRSATNMFSLINRLPPELLSQIFSYLQDTLRLGHSASLINVTHTCRHWRNVALQDPALWSCFALHNDLCVKECLARSKAMPISVSFTKPPSLASTRYLEGAIQRVRSIRIIVPDTSEIKILLSKIRAGAPLLEELHVEQDPDPADRYRWYGQAALLTGSATLAFNANFEVRSLKTMILYDVPFTFFPSDALEHLKLKVVASRRLLLSLSILLHVFERCPSLQTIELKGLLHLESDVAQITVALPKLASIFLELEPALANAQLLSSLALPEQTRARVFSRLSYDESFEHLMHPFDPLSPPHRYLDVLRRVLLSCNEAGMQIRAHRDVRDVPYPPVLDIEAIYGRWGGPRPAQCFARRWPFDASHVETLVLAAQSLKHLGNSAGSDVWTTILRTTPRLDTLFVIGLDVPGVVELAEVLKRTGTGRVCPRLGLEFMDVLMWSGAVWNGLLNVAVARAAMGEEESGGLRRVETFNSKFGEAEEWEPKFRELGVELRVHADEMKDMCISRCV